MHCKLPESKLHEDAIGCQNLARCIIQDAIDDIARRRKGRSKEHIPVWKEAYNWVFSKEFDFWCELANVCPEEHRTKVYDNVHEGKKLITKRRVHYVDAARKDPYTIKS